MRKSVRFSIIGVAVILVGLLANIAARALTDGASTTAGSILLDVSLLAWLAGAVLLIVAIALAVRAAWRWSKTPKPGTHEAQP